MLSSVLIVRDGSSVVPKIEPARKTAAVGAATLGQRLVRCGSSSSHQATRVLREGALPKAWASLPC